MWAGSQFSCSWQKCEFNFIQQISGAAAKWINTGKRWIMHFSGIDASSTGMLEVGGAAGRNLISTSFLVLDEMDFE